jgi:hypothetical protein
MIRGKGMKEKFKRLMPFFLVLLIVFSLYQRNIVLKFRQQVHLSVQSNLTEFVKEVRNVPHDEAKYAILYANITTSEQLYKTYSLSGAKSLKERNTLLLGLMTELKYLLRNKRESIVNTFTSDSEATMLLVNISTNLYDNNSIMNLIKILESKHY